MLWHRDEYLELMTFGRVERQMFVELFGPLIGLDQEWRAQGASQEEIDMVAFDWDHMHVAYTGAHVGLRGGPERQVLEDNDTYTIWRDGLGRTMKLVKATATIALPMDFPVKNMDDWRRLKPLFTFHEDRVDLAHIEKARKARAEGAIVVAGILGAFDMPRELMGEEVACMAYYDQPELMHDMLQTFSDTAFEVYRRIADKLTIDQLSVHEDMAGRSGPMAGPAQVREFFKPYYQRIWGLLQSHGAKLFSMDTDGNVDAIIDDLLDCGLNSIYPNEPAAGTDIVALRKKYGRRLTLRGGINKFVLSQGRDAIRRELEYKMQSLMRQGGVVFGLDHRIPNGAPLAEYRYYVDLGREILGLPPRGDGRGWGRMAF